MGNVISSSTGNVLATAAMSKYVSISKDQVIMIRRDLVSSSSTPTTLPTNSSGLSHPSSAFPQILLPGGGINFTNQQQKQKQPHVGQSAITPTNEMNSLGKSNEFHTNNNRNNDTLFIPRPKFMTAITKAKIKEYPDREVLELLHTVMDVNGTGVSCNDLCIGIGILACPNENFESILKFSLNVMHNNLDLYTRANSNNSTRRNSNSMMMISSHDALCLLQSKYPIC